MNRRLKQFIDSLNFSIREFETSVGAANGTLRKHINHGTSIKSELVITILTTYPQLSAEWLLRGSGNMLLLHDGETDRTIVALIRRIEELTIENYRLKHIGNDKRQTTK